MIGNIFRKDVRLLWPMAAIVGLTQCLTAALLSLPGEFERAVGGNSQYGWLSNDALPMICLLGIVVLTVAVVQLDRLPGSTQDWLTRPIPRGQLVAAKSAFILVVALGPVLFSDVLSGIAEHLPWIEVIGASLTRVVMLFGLVCVPAFLIACVTRSLTEALVFTLGVVIVIAIEMIVLAELGIQAPLAASGFAWTILLVLFLVNMAAIAVLLPLQLRWRATNRVRWIAIGYLCTVPAVIFLPWSAGLRIHEVLARNGQQQSFVVGVDSSRKARFSKTLNGNRNQADLSLPVSVSPSERDQLWQLDYGYVQLIDPAGGKSLGTAHAYMSADPDSEGAAERVFVSVPTDLFLEAQARRATIRAVVFLTTFRLVSSQPATRLNPGSIDQFSRCRREDRGMTRCVSTRPVATCVEIENPEAARRRLLTLNDCRRTPYSPWPLGLWRDPYFTFVLPPPSGSAFRLGRRVSDAGSDQEKDSRTLRNYAPDRHLERLVEFSLVDVTEGPDKRGPKSRDGVGTAARFAAPAGMAADSHGNVFVVDEADGVVRRITTSGEVTTFAGKAGVLGRNDGQGSDALFDHPSAIAVDAQDNIYIADTGNALVRKISPAGVVITVAGGASSKSADVGGPKLIHPTGIVLTHDGSLYVIDYNQARGAAVLKVLPDGALKPVAGPDPSSAPDGRLPTPEWIE